MTTSDVAPTGRTVELRSDTFTTPSPHMLEAMARAEVGDDCYGEDPTVRALERRAAELLGKEAACFLPSGTMANLVCLLAHCPRGSKVIVGDESDIYVYEAGGASVCGGVVYYPLPTAEDGTLALDDVAAAFPDDPEDPQFALPALLCLENPHNRCGGRVLALPYLADAARLVGERGIPLHLDGARLFNAAIAAATPPETIAAHADSVQFCLSKGLGAPVGSVAVGTGPLIRRARRARKMLGGGMRQAGVLAAAGLVALEEMPTRLAEDNANARQLAQGLAELEGVEIASPPETNMVFFRITHPGVEQRLFISRAEASGVRIAELGHGRIRAVTHSGVDSKDIEYAVEVFAAALRTAGTTVPTGKSSAIWR
ncbi:low-specificity L-threonine aldolase [Streptosporangium sp. NPDC001681]|uniref:low-specificity L-threonine aldolase n=1 Tax=Streptosporangium sp. NPDC001681 TaxID=3154395 RepID=UPI00332C0740